jgi:hypothetical protein
MRIITTGGAIAAIRDLPVESAALVIKKTMGRLGSDCLSTIVRFCGNRQRYLETRARSPSVAPFMEPRVSADAQPFRQFFSRLANGLLIALGQDVKSSSDQLAGSTANIGCSRLNTRKP